MPDTPDRSRNTGPALEKRYQFLRWLTSVLEKFPRSHKFTLGERIYTGARNMLNRLPMNPAHGRCHRGQVSGAIEFV